MQQKGVLPDVIMYSASIHACEKGTLAERALEIFENMLRQSAVPDSITHTALISACEKGKRP